MGVICERVRVRERGICTEIEAQMRVKNIFVNGVKVKL